MRVDNKGSGRKTELFKLEGSKWRCAEMTEEVRKLGDSKGHPRCAIPLRSSAKRLVGDKLYLSVSGIQLSNRLTSTSVMSAILSNYAIYNPKW